MSRDGRPATKGYWLFRHGFLLFNSSQAGPLEPLCALLWSVVVSLAGYRLCAMLGRELDKLNDTRGCGSAKSIVQLAECAK
ncbi:hypothetical protein BDV10DRAFT_158621 [Aspergillus recurvatus]